MMRKWNFLQVCVLTTLCIIASGCSNKFWDPTQIGRFRPVPVEHIILDSLGVAEEDSPVYEGAEDPKPSDIVAIDEDYVFNSGDIVRISIFELLEENIPFVNDYIVTETGKISIPEVGTVQAGGLTEKQLEEEIRQILSPSILKDPAVTVILQQSQKRVFSIYGQGLLGSAGRYPIPRYNFRLAEAIATAGGAAEFNVSYIYITRQLTPAEVEQKIQESKKTPKAAPAQQIQAPKANNDELLDLIAPFDGNRAVSQVVSGAEFTPEDELEALLEPQAQPKTEIAQNNVADTEAADAADNLTAEQAPQEPEKIEWIFENGKWVPIQSGTPSAKAEPAKEVEKELEILKEEGPEQLFSGIGDELRIQTRVLKIPYDRLVGGDPKYNIVIKAGDTISVPVDVIGECVIMGNVNAQGYVPLTGRPMTLMQAVAAAGGLGPLAAPQNVEVRRRIGKKREEIVMVNLKKISEGLQPDFFIKKDDTINVGTDSTAIWLATLRNSFRANYGFGFVYDRNFADRDINTSRPFTFF